MSSVSSTPSASSSASSSASVGSSSSGGSCEDSGPGEPNESEAKAHDLGTITDDDADAVSVSGVIAGDGDEDWYRYTALDELFGVVDPARSMVQSETGLVLCKYVECADGLSGTEVTCEDGSSSDVTSAGRPGCCKGSDFGMTIECPGANDSATIYLRLLQPSATPATCNAYKITYHF